MDWWIVKQLRATILSDLQDFIPKDYFAGEVDNFKLHDGIQSNEHLSHEMRWGYLAAKLGKDLFYDPPLGMSARQVSASDVLMNLGMLVAAEAAQNVTTQLSENAEAKGVSDGNSGLVAEQLKQEQIPPLLNNAMGAIEQYLRHLTPLEAAPYSPLITTKQQIDVENGKGSKGLFCPSKVINNTFNVGGSFNGNLQTGESSAIDQTVQSSKPEKSSHVKWLMDNIVGVVISGIILAALLSWLGLSVP